ncbi:hypothetical protein [Stenotrophomonas phage BUCT603B1]|nr:hypothetical protein [Stenotrophomonas phage BUCT603B1]
MSYRPSDAVTVTSLGAGASYLNWVSTYGASVVTTLAILVAVTALAKNGWDLYDKWRKQKQEDGDVHSNNGGE